jgi:hypothetical protein
MKTGVCALCGQLCKLHESHFLPKGIYRLLRESNSKNNNPVLISARVSMQKSYQMTQPLLCSACERRFSDNGESYVLPLLKRRGKFPLLDRLKVAIPLYTTPQNAAFTCPSLGLDGEKIAYFGLSILWRAAVRPWRTFDGELISIQLEPQYQVIHPALPGGRDSISVRRGGYRYRGDGFRLPEYLLAAEPNNR